MGTKKFRLLKAVAIICFIFAIIEFGLGVFTIVSPYADENVDQLIQATKEDDNTNLADLNEEEYSIVGALEADPFENKISDRSPIGAAIIGKKKGDSVQATTNKNKVIKIKILDVFKA